MKKIALAGAALLALGACEAKFGDDGEAEGGNVSAEGKAQENRFSIKAPGVDIKVAIPESIRNNTQVDSDSELLHPGAKLNGIHIEGREKQGEVELRFTSAEAPQNLVAWYRDPARTGFTVDGNRQEGQAQVIQGRTKEDGSAFTVRLEPGADGGTDGRLLLRDRS